MQQSARRLLPVCAQSRRSRAQSLRASKVPQRVLCLKVLLLASNMRPTAYMNSQLAAVAQSVPSSDGVEAAQKSGIQDRGQASILARSGRLTMLISEGRWGTRAAWQVASDMACSVPSRRLQAPSSKLCFGGFSHLSLPRVLMEVLRRQQRSVRNQQHDSAN